MNKHFFQVLLLLAAISVSSCSDSPIDQIDSLKRLEGTWVSTGNVLFFEQWEIIDDTTLRGLGYSINNDDTVYNEQLYIQKDSESVNYIAIVWKQNNAEPVLFELVKNSSGRFEFENPVHDYPKRIIYDFMSDTVFRVQLETLRGTKQRNFMMKKISK
jgi:hypothetical protein